MVSQALFSNNGSENPSTGKHPGEFGSLVKILAEGISLSLDWQWGRHKARLSMTFSRIFLISILKRT